ncbi:MAG: ABC transporter ATP-binding protein [Burkholderiaceae bacterium]
MRGSRLLEVSHVTKRFGGLQAVNGVSFGVDPNQVVGLIGPNGSGKTTMMNMISGALRVTSGDIFFQDRLISNRPPRTIFMRGVSRTFQLVRPLAGLTPLESVMAGVVFSRLGLWGREAVKAAERALARVGMGGRETQPMAALTYIDQKRVELARAMVSQPTLLLLDEWLAGLNPTELGEGIELVRSIQQDGTTIILVEHLMDAIRSLCDTCVVMNAGQLIAQGAPDQALQHPEVIAAYLGDSDGV